MAKPPSRSSGPRSGGPRPARSGSGASRSGGPRAAGPRSTDTRGEDSRDARPRSDKPHSDRPRSDRPRSDKPRSDRPRSDRPRSDRPRSDRPRSDRPRGERAQTDGPRTERPRSGERRAAPARSNARPATARPATPRPAKPAGPPREEQRIAKLLARAGVASRRDIERMIEEGRIALNGEVLTTPATLLKSLHGVTVDGNPVKEPSPTRLFLFHKPAGVLTAARDPKGRPTIYDRLPADLPRLMPIGRLDMNTEGLLLLTTDGEFKREMELPSTGVERTYRARAFGTISQEQLEELIHGIEIDGMHYGRIDANLERRTGRNQWVEMTLTEGKNREVRRVLEHFGLEVSRLIRTRYGPFTLGDSAPGDLVEVRRADLVAFRKTLEK